MFKRGILIGLKEWMSRGGQLCPNSIVGEMLLWKKAQKNDTKKNTSEVINRIIPVFNPFITISEWFPWLVASRWISRHHEKATINMIIKVTIITFFVTLFTRRRPDSTRAKAPFEAKIGQGLTSTRWNGLNFLIIT